MSTILQPQKRDGFSISEASIPHGAKTGATLGMCTCQVRSLTQVVEHPSLPFPVKKALEKENKRLRKIVAELELDKLILKESLDFLKPKA